MTVNTIAREFGHHFGSKHDGGNSSMYRGSWPARRQGASATAACLPCMPPTEEENEGHCFAEAEEDEELSFAITSKDFTGDTVDCPPD